MKALSQEFYELQQQFEKDIKHVPIYTGNLKKEDKSMYPKQRFYCDGVVNALFVGYMMGYENAKCLARLNDLSI